MMKHVLKIVVLVVIAAGLALGTSQINAQTNTPPAAKAKKEKKEKKEKSKATGLPFRGKVTKIDTMAKTLTVGKRTFQVTSKTRITKDGKPATLEDGQVGEPVSGYARKSEDGQLNAATIHFGKASAKPREKSEKKSTDQ